MGEKFVVRIDHGEVGRAFEIDDRCGGDDEAVEMFEGPGVIR